MNRCVVRVVHVFVLFGKGSLAGKVKGLNTYVKGCLSGS